MEWVEYRGERSNGVKMGDKGVFITSKHVLRHQHKGSGKGWAQVVCTKSFHPRATRDNLGSRNTTLAVARIDTSSK